MTDAPAVGRPCVDHVCAGPQVCPRCAGPAPCAYDTCGCDAVEEARRERWRRLGPWLSTPSPSGHPGTVPGMTDTEAQAAVARVRELAATWERRAVGYAEAGDLSVARELRARATALRRALDGPTSVTVPGRTDAEALTAALRVHHPIMRSETGPFSGCRCGGVRLGQDVIAHVVGELRAALSSAVR